MLIFSALVCHYFGLFPTQLSSMCSEIIITIIIINKNIIVQQEVQAQSKYRQKKRESIQNVNQIIYSTLMLVFSALVCCYFRSFPIRPSSLWAATSSSSFNNKRKQAINADKRERERIRMSACWERERLKKSTLMLIFSALVSCYFVLFPRRPPSLCVAISSSLFNNNAQARIKWRQEQKERAFRTWSCWERDLTGRNPYL